MYFESTDLGYTARELSVEGNKWKVFCPFMEYRWDFHNRETARESDGGMPITSYLL